MGPLAPTSECCAPECDEPASIQVPGPPGLNGLNGTNGTNGVSSSTQTTAQFVMPAEGANVSVPVLNTSWMAVGQTLFLVTAGFMEVANITNLTTVVLKNLENTASSLYTVNAAPATVIAAATPVVAAGVQGPSGVLTGAASGDLKGNFPSPKIGVNNVKGHLLVGNGTDSVTLAPGANGTVLHADSAQATGQTERAIDLAGTNTALTGDLRVVDGGTGASTATAGFNNLSPLTTRGDTLVRDATNNVRKGIGAANTVWKSDGTDPDWGKINANNLETTGATALSRVPSDVILITDDKATTTAGGTFTSGSWQTHTLTTEVIDTGSHSAIAANQITLQAGTYRFRGWTLGYKVDNHQCRLQNITAGTTVAFGNNARAAAAGDDVTKSEVEGRVTIAGATVFELQSRCSATRATDGFGPANSFGGTERYAAISFEREAI